MTYSTFKDVDSEVKDIVIKTYEAVKKKSIKDYILLLADGNYADYLEGNSIGLWPMLLR